MSVLYPRLLPGATEKLFAELHTHQRGSLHRMVSTSFEHAVFAATGGQRVTRTKLEELRTAVVDIAERCGMPTTRSQGALNDFDRRVARHLHANMDVTPGEAAQPQVWAYLALVLLPDVCAWRFLPRPEGYVGDRFKGTDLTRHTLGRLWTRAHVLHDSQNANDPYALLQVLGEADLDQVMARRDAVAASPALVRSVVRSHRDDVDLDGPPARLVLRESLKRLLRMTAFMDFDGLVEPSLMAVVLETRAAAREVLT